MDRNPGGGFPGSGKVVSKEELEIEVSMGEWVLAVEVRNEST